MSAMKPGGMPRPTDEAKAAFLELLPSGPDVAVRPMFGNLAGFVNGNMFTGLFGEGLFVRLPDDLADRLRADGGGPFEPMPGRAMGGYTMLGAGWRADRDGSAAWIERALAWARTLPPKPAKPAGASKATRTAKQG